MKRSLFISEELSANDAKKIEAELRLGYLNLEDQMFDQAKMNFDLALQIDNSCAEAYWGLLLVKFQLDSEEKLFIDAATYKSALYLPEYENALKYASEKQKKIYQGLLERIYKINEGDKY